MKYLVSIHKSILVLLSLFFSSSLFADELGKLYFVIALLWQGQIITETNLKHLQTLRNTHSDIKFHHFISPSYFLRSKEEAQISQKLLKSVILSDEPVGLYLSGWKSVIESSNVVFRNFPTFWGNKITDADCIKDCGHEVPITIYKPEEIDSIFKKSISTLETAGFSNIRSFISGGWMSSSSVRSAAVKHSIHFDLSGVPYTILQKHIQFDPLYNWLAGNWSQMTPFSQPSLEYYTTNWLLSIPNNLAHIEYLTTKEWFDIVNTYCQLWLRNKQSNLVAVIGLSQESATFSSYKLGKGLSKIKENLIDKKVPFSFSQNIFTDFRQISKDEIIQSASYRVFQDVSANR